MAKSLLEQLPEIVAKGRKKPKKYWKTWKAATGRLQTREWVLPSKDSVTTDWITANERRGHLNPSPSGRGARAREKTGKPPDLRRQPAGDGGIAGG